VETPSTSACTVQRARRPAPTLCVIALFTPFALTGLFCDSDVTPTSLGPSPEKAGVGGSIPSLATIFSSTYVSVITRLPSNTFQKPNCVQRLVLFLRVQSLSFRTLTSTLSTSPRVNSITYSRRVVLANAWLSPFFKDLTHKLSNSFFSALKSLPPCRRRSIKAPHMPTFSFLRRS